MMVSKVRFAWLLLVSSFACASLPACKSEKSDEATSADSAEPVTAGSGDHARRGKHQLPPAAFDACQGKGVGDACTVTFGEKQIEAKCSAAPDGRLACRPEHGEHKKPD